jgi:transposase
MAAWRRAIELSLGDADTAKLRSIAQSRTEPASRVERARILLAYREDPSFFAVSRALGLHHQTVQRCVERAVAEGPWAALDDRPRPGREPTITLEAKAWLVSLACRKAKDLGYPHELWTTRLLARHAREHGPAEGHACLVNLAQGTVCKILDQEEVKPHKVRYYLEQRDPDFAEKMAEVRLSPGEDPQAGGSRVEEEEKAERGGGDHLLRREAGYPGDRDDRPGFAARARRPRDLRT